MRNARLRAAWLTLSLLLAGATFALQSAEPQLVLDIDTRGEAETNTAFSYLNTLGTVNGRTLFDLVPPEGSFAVRGGLWTSDGTVAGTLSLGPATPVSDSYGVRALASAGRLTYFRVQRLRPDGPASNELWRTDGTVAGTFFLIEMGPDIGYHGMTLAPFSGRAFFTRCDGLGCEPWSSDGTVAGTRLLRDLTPGRFGSEPREPIVLHGTLYFLASAPEGIVLWRTDGSTRGTLRVLTYPAGVEPRGLTATSDRLYFSTGAYSGSPHGTRATLWTSDGTAAGTRLLPPFDSTRPRGPSFVDPLGSLAGTLYFRAWDPSSRFQLWRTDGTPGGTLRLLDLGSDYYAAGPPAAMGDRAFFFGPGETLWSTRGTRASTTSVTPCRPRCKAQLRPLYPSAAPLRVGDRLVFAGRDAATGTEPWVSDGTAAGTWRLADVCHGSCDSYPYFLGSTPGRIYFSTQTADLWVTDGTEAGTMLLAPGKAGETLRALGTLRSSGPKWARLASDSLGEGADEEGVLVFARQDPARGAEIWRTDGTAAGTRAVLGLSNGAGSNPSWLAPLAGGVVFSACDGTQDLLWTSHGEAADTVPFFLAPYCYFFEPGFLTLGGAAFFDYYDASGNRTQIWRTDGTPGGTRQITAFADERSGQVISGDFQGGILQLRTGEYGSIPQLWRIDPNTERATLLVEPTEGKVWTASATADRLFYTVEDSYFENSLWTSDGTLAGTRRLVYFGRAWDSAYPFDPTPLGGATFLRIVDFNFAEVWRTDGTPAGTRRILADPDGPVQVEKPIKLAALRGSLLVLDLRYSYEGTKLALVRSDGTTAGSTVIKVLDLGRERDVFAGAPALALGDSFYFLASTPESGEELWRSDGTAAGTTLVRDIAPGPADSRVQTLTVTGGRLAFSADDGVHGAELWTSDGTAEGTRREGDVAPGPLSSTPSSMAAAGGWLYFSADDGVHGRELWKVPFAPPGSATSAATAPRRAHP